MKRLAFLLTLGVAGAASSTPATLTLTGQARPIAPLAVNGFNTSWQMPLVEALDAVRSVTPTSIRFPGGNVGDDHDLTEHSLRNYKASLALTGTNTVALVQTRVFATRPEARNRPEDAGQAARAARDMGLNVAYWEIGNEPDLYATNRGDPSWTPEKYCQVFRAQREAILKADPSAKIAGPATSKGTGPAMNYLERFIRACGDVVDLVTWHEYPTDGTARDEVALATAPDVTARVEQIRELLRDPQRNPLGHQRDHQLGVTEYSLSWRSQGPHLADQVAALWAAETTLRLADAGVDVSSYFAIIAAGNHGLVDLAGIPRPTLYAFRQLRHYRGESLAIHSSDPALWVHAARDASTTQVLITNTATTPRAVATELPGYQLIGAKTFTEQTVADEADFIRMKLGNTVELPGRSLTRLAYKRLP